MATLKEILTRRPVAATIRLTVPAGAARPAPPVGPALGQYRLNLMAFCKDFNARTQKYKADTPMAVTITAFKDNTFEFTVKSPSVTWYLKKAAGIESGSSRPGHVVASTLTIKHVYEIAKKLESLQPIRQSQFLLGKFFAIMEVLCSHVIPLDFVLSIAMDRAIKEIVSSIMQRSVSIATQTTKELVLKDYAMESDETRIRNAAHLMVEPLRGSITSQLRNSLQLIEQSVLLVTNDNLDLGCALIEQVQQRRQYRPLMRK